MRDVRTADSFFDVPTVRQDTSAGPVDLPIRYRDASAIVLAYRTPADNAAPLLEPSGLVPFADSKGRTQVAVIWFEYRNTSIGPYNELAVTVSAGPRALQGRLSLRQLIAPLGFGGSHVVHLPVTTRIAHAAGCEIWGYPKIVADMPIEFRRDHMSAALVHEGEPILRAEVPLRRGVAVPMPNVSTLTGHHGRVIRTTIRTKCRVTLNGGKGARLSVESADHPIGRTFEQLRLPEAPDAVLWTHRFQSLLPFGVPIADIAPAGG